MINTLRIFALGIGRFASFFITFERETFYPYKFPSEALTRDWEVVGKDIHTARNKYEEVNGKRG